MKSKAFLLFLLLCILLCGCDAGNASVGNETTIPLDRILEALQTDSISVYESAFPPSFCKQYRDAFPDTEEMLELLLSTANGFNRETYGEDVTLRYELKESDPYDHTSFEEYYASTSLGEFVYTMPVSQITEAKQITVCVYTEGSYLEAEQEVTYLVLCIGGNWYLHPRHFGTVLKA